MNRKIILASSSPRRQELLKKANIDFEVIKPTFDESTFDLKPTYQSIEKLSLLKAKSVTVNLSVSALVISADTVVISDNEILGKPKSYEQAYGMLQKLSGKTHHVITAFAVADTETLKEYTSYDITYVTFNNLTDEMIKNYIETKKPYDKAGSYGIQELPDGFLNKIDGDFDNVMGLPTKNLIKIIKNLI